MRGFHQGQSTSPRAGETSGFDAPITDQCDADFVPRIEQQGKHAFGQSAGPDRLRHCAADQFAGAGMRAVRLDDHRATSRQCRSGVATGHGKCQGKVARTKHRDRPQGNLPLAQVGARQWLALRLRTVDAHIQPFTRAHRTGEQAQLRAGAATLALKACRRQTSFGVGAFDQFIAKVFDVLGNAFEKCRTAAQAGFAIFVLCCPGQGAGLFHLFG